MTLSNKVQQFKDDADLVNAWAHGPATGSGSTVETDSGPVRTPAKLIQDKDQEINQAANGVLAESREARDEAQRFAQQAAPLEFAAFASIVLPESPRLVLVVTDETNGGARTLYFYDGAQLNWLPTVGV